MTLIRKQWVWHFDPPPEALWPVLSDTARFNEAAGGFHYQIDEIAQPDGTVRRYGHGKLLGLRHQWEERPYQWVRQHSFTQDRFFSKGLFRRFGPELKLEAHGSGSRVTYELFAEPLHPLMRLFGPLVLRKAGEVVEKLVKQSVDFLKGARPMPFDFAPPQVGAEARQRLDGLAARLEQGPYGHGLAHKLTDFLRTGQDIDVARLRPKRLAKNWQVAERQVIELCLAATKIGMLGLRWDLLCSSCRGAKASVGTLDLLPNGAHCPSCNIDFGRDFDRNVELVFFPNAFLREAAPGGFCMSGPMTTPHVLVQQILAPGESRSLDADLAPGDYRFRAIAGLAAADFTHGGGGFPTLIATDGGIAAGPPASPGKLVIENRRSAEATLLVETRDWIKEALTAHQATTLQCFRDLFNEATLRPGDEAGVQSVALMFTDLKGSTELYEKVGDAAAFNLVREHFAFLGRVVRESNGAIVKTIGDAVMAAFGDPADAVRAALAIQHQVTAFNADHPLARGASKEGGAPAAAIVIKLGLHKGSCIVVNLNERLDYFGSAVNLAARLQGTSEGGDIVLSEALAEDGAVQAVLADLDVRREAVALKGFAAPVTFWRILPAAA